MENSLPLLRDGRQVYFIFLPEGEDPDTYVRSNGKAAFSDDNLRVPLSEFLFNSLSKNINLESLEGRSEMVNKTLPYLSLLPSDPYKDILTQQLSKMTHYDIEDIQQRLTSSSSNSNTRNVIKRSSTEQNKGLEKIRWLIRCLLHQPELAHKVESIKSLSTFTAPGIIFLCELIEFIKRTPNITLASILENWRDTKFESRLHALATDEDSFDEIGVTAEVFLDAIDGLIESNKKEFEIFKTKTSPSDLTEEEKAKYREMQKSPTDS